jgi:hypothetical protein
LAATWYHKRVGQWLIAALVVLHIGAVLYYLAIRKENLIRPMIVGDKAVEGAVPEARDTTGSRMLALAILLICGGAVGMLVRWAGNQG